MPAPIPKEEVLTDMQRVADQLGRAPTMSEYGEHGQFARTTPCDKFGSWNDAKAAAGLEQFDPGSGAEFTEEFVVPEQERISDEDLLEDLQRVADELGRQPTTEEYRQRGDYGLVTYLRRWDSWAAAKSGAGVSPTRIAPGLWSGSRAELISELRRIGAEADGVPTRSDLDGSEFSSRPFYREFGTWNAALREAGFEPQHRVDIPREELLDGIRKTASKLGRSPYKHEVATYSQFGESTYTERFESWTAACRAAGVEPSKNSPASTSELLTDLQSIGEALGRPPSANDIRTHGSYSVNPYLRVFGSVGAAVEAAGFTPNPPTGAQHHLWRGGAPDGEQYSAGWQSIRDEIIERDGNRCLDCGIGRETHRDEFDTDLAVHHRHPAREFDSTTAAEDPANLFTVCVRCHPRWEQLVPLRPRVV